MPRRPAFGRSTLSAALIAAAIGLGVPALAQAGVGSHMSCIAPTDSAGIDAMLERAGSPLAGDGGTFVREGRMVGIDPRFLVAVAAHETMLATYGPSQLIHNPFGLGPHWSFPSYADAIGRAAFTLASYYIPEGRDSIGAIGAKWAPLGVSNDPTNLNQHWSGGVGTFYRALGGDADRPVLLSTQDPGPDCAPASIDLPTLESSGEGGRPTTPDPEPTGPPVVTAWGGAAPVVGSGPAGGSAPDGGPALVPGFVFPLALPRDAGAEYPDSFSHPGPVPCVGDMRLQCALTIASTPGHHAVAMAAGTLATASIAEREEGLGLWIITASGDRLGYGALGTYRSGIVPGAQVRAGQPLGLAPGRLRVTWEHGGVRTNLHPLLSVTRPAPTTP